MGRNIIKRGGKWRYKRRVPTDLVDLVGKRFEEFSLHTSSESVALRKAEQINPSVEAEWQDRRELRTAQAEEKHAAVMRLAQRLGYEYRTEADLAANAPLDEILQRGGALLAMTPKEQQPADDVGAALLGFSEAPKLMISQIAERFFELSPDRLIGKSEDQRRRWRNPRLKAVREFLDAVGEKPLANLSRADLLAYRSQQWERAEAGEIKLATANKQFDYLLPMLRELESNDTFELPRLEKLKFKGAEEGKRVPIPHDIILRMLAPGALDRLNAEARRMLFVLIMTGARPSEIAGLEPDEIRLEANIPHICIQPNRNRQLKNPSSRREMPLVGAALEAMRAQPEGFPSYRNSANATAAANKFLRENAFLSGEVTVYGARHSFSDYLIAITPDERLRCSLMGHKYKREQEYGEGFPLDAKVAVLSKIPLPTPQSV